MREKGKKKFSSHEREQAMFFDFFFFERTLTQGTAKYLELDLMRLASVLAEPTRTSLYQSLFWKGTPVGKECL